MYSPNLRMLPEWRTGARLEIGDGCGDLLVLQIAVSCHFDCCRIVIFFSPWATTAEV
jgi:hypothetical protein